MSRVLPILFNTEMVRAILDDRKTVTRRVVKYKYSNTEMKVHKDKYGTRLIEIQKDVEGETYGKNPDGSTWRKLRGYIEPKPPYQPGDILYVRETWCWEPCWDCGMDTEEHNCCDESAHKIYNHNKKEWGCYGYKASLGDNVYPSVDVWHPSIHMSKEAARIWLKVTDIRVERLQDITEAECKKEGFSCKNEFIHTFLSMYPECTEKSWLWVIEFERCEKPERKE